VKEGERSVTIAVAGRFSFGAQVEENTRYAARIHPKQASLWPGVVDNPVEYHYI